MRTREKDRASERWRKIEQKRDRIALTHIPAVWEKPGMMDLQPSTGPFTHAALRVCQNLDLLKLKMVCNCTAFVVHFFFYHVAI